MISSIHLIKLSIKVYRHTENCSWAVHLNYNFKQKEINFDRPIRFFCVNKVSLVLGSLSYSQGTITLRTLIFTHNLYIFHSRIKIVLPLQLNSFCDCFCLYCGFYNTPIDVTHKEQENLSSLLKKCYCSLINATFGH